MCIALISTAHPDYALILIDNRDEYLSRPTASAAWWPSPNPQVLGGHDLLRNVRGTWLGVTKQGRIAVLTNFHEEGQVVQEARSRGAMVNAFLTQTPDNPENTPGPTINTDTTAISKANDEGDTNFNPKVLKPSRSRNFSMPMNIGGQIINQNVYMSREDQAKYAMALEAQDLETEKEATAAKKNRNFLNLTLAKPEGDQAKENTTGLKTSARKINIEDFIDKDSGEDLEDEDPTKIHTSLHPTIWLGRLSSLSDRYRTEALFSHSPRAGPDHPMHNDKLRYRRAFDHLYECCTTREAKKSLAEFRRDFEGKKGWDFGVVGKGKGKKEEDWDGDDEGGEGGKKGVFEKLGLTGGRKKGGGAC